jgi:pimeloyl-ACP methyl ester carboxylesterase
VGHSMGATVVFMYAQTHPDKVAGFVSMNPVPPQTTYLKAIRKVQTKPEYQSELAFYRGENDEQISFGSSEQQLTIPLPATMPYVVMFDENCEGDSAFLPPRHARADTGHQGDGRRRQGRPVFSCEGCRSSDLRN